MKRKVTRTPSNELDQIDAQIIREFTRFVDEQSTWPPLPPTLRQLLPMLDITSTSSLLYRLRKGKRLGWFTKAHGRWVLSESPHHTGVIQKHGGAK